MPYKVNIFAVVQLGIEVFKMTALLLSTTVIEFPVLIQKSIAQANSQLNSSRLHNLCAKPCVRSTVIRHIQY